MSKTLTGRVHCRGLLLKPSKEFDCAKLSKSNEVELKLKTAFSKENAVFSGQRAMVVGG